MAIREIDRELIYLRREEAKGCMRNRLFHAATLTAGSGVELLLECLVGDLHRALLTEKPELAKKLESELERFRSKRKNVSRWGLGVWIDFYKKYRIPFRLSETLGYKSEYFSDERIRDVNKLWNKCKHDIYEVTPDSALSVVSYFDELLDEVGILSVEERGKLVWRQTWGKQISLWTVQNRNTPETILLTKLFPLLEVVGNLIKDERVEFEYKSRLIVAENYVYSTLDWVKEDTDRPHSLIDDAAVLTLTLYWLLRKPCFDKAFADFYWQGETRLEEEIERLYDIILRNHAKLFPDSPGQVGRYLVWTPLSRVATEGPEALWQNYWKEAY